MCRKRTIQAALVWKLSRHNTKDIIIHSDWKAALTILQNRIYKTYPEITSKIFKSAKLLHRQGTQATIHWIPSHVDLDGNEHADRQANIATSLNEVLHAEQTAGAYSHLIKSHFSQQLRHNTICPHCQQDFTPIHYLINCPAHPHLPTTTKGPINPSATQLDWPRHCRTPHQKGHHHPRHYSPFT